MVLVKDMDGIEYFIFTWAELNPKLICKKFQKQWSENDYNMRLQFLI